MEPVWTLNGQLSAGGPSRSVSLKVFPFRVGRRSDLPLSLPKSTISGAHAEFFLDGERLMLQDLQSTNGTFVNGTRLTTPAELQHDDLVQFADMPFRLCRESAGFDSRTMNENVCDWALALVQFDTL